MKLKLLLPMLAVLSVVPVRAQQFDDFGRGKGREMLRNIIEDLKKHYYDPKFHGVDLEALVREADEKLRHATSTTESFKVIAGALGSLNDPHTYFIPPSNHYRVDYGWQMQMIGPHCYVTHVRPKSDAETKGLKPGDEIISVNNAKTDRDGLEMLGYIITILSPQPELRLHVRSAGGQERELVVAAKVEPIKIMASNIMAEAQTTLQKARKLEQKTFPHCESVETDLGICKIPAFVFEDQQTHELLNFARKHQALILDLRGNRGGSITTLERLLGVFFDHEIKIGDQISRKDAKPQIAKPQKDPFSEKLVVLIDSLSASQSELFARIVQLQNRGTIIGDRSSGLVRESQRYTYQFKLEPATESYMAMITEADIIMANGESLEHKGVIPDQVLLPTQADLASGNDPVLAHAAELLGFKLSPDKAGKLFPFEWMAE